MPTTVDATTFDKNVANVVRVLMSARQIDANELGALLGIAHSTLYEKLKGKSWKGLELDRMADIFDVSPRVFFEPVEKLLASASPWITTLPPEIIDAIAV